MKFNSGKWLNFLVISKVFNWWGSNNLLLLTEVDVRCMMVHKNKIVAPNILVLLSMLYKPSRLLILSIYNRGGVG